MCPAGQTRRGSEEEQGAEGGSLPVEERRREIKKEGDWEFSESVTLKKKQKKEMKTVQEKKRTQKQLEQKGEKTSFHI